jgi:hypothetical protein
MVSWVRRAEDLGPTLVELTDGVRGREQREAGLELFESDPARVVADVARGMEALPNPLPRPSSRTRGRRGRRARRAGVLVCLAVAALNWYVHHHAQQPTPPGRRR